MMHGMKVTTEGQVTIPPNIREKFHLLPGTDVEFVPQGDAVIIRPAGSEEKNRFQRWIQRARDCATTKLTTDEIMAMTRGED